MAIDFSPLQQIDPGGAFLQGRERARAEQERNMLRQQQAEQMAMQRQRQQTEFEQGQEDRRRRLQQEAQFEKMADLIRQNGLDPDDPKVLGQFSEAALLSRQPQLASFVTSMAERAAKRTAAKQEIERDKAEMARIQGPAPAAAPTAKRVPLPAAPAAPTNMLAGTPFDIGTTQPAPAAPVNALAAPPAAAEPMVGGFTRSQINEMAGSSVKNVRERGERLLKLLPKEPAAVAPSEVVKLNRELAVANAAGDAGLAADIKARLARITEKPVGTTIVNKLPEQEKAERGERGKLLVAEYKVVSDAARLATRTLPALETQERVLDAGFRTGFGTEAQKAGASLFAALGVPEAKDYATNAQTFLSAMNQAVLQKQLEQKGTQTKADADRIEQTGAQLTNTTDANRFIIGVARAQLKRDIAQRNFYDKWWKENKTYDGAEDAWATGEGNKSLFEDPALKKFAPAPATATPAVPARKASPIQEQADAILRKGNN